MKLGIDTSKLTNLFAKYSTIIIVVAVVIVFVLGLVFVIKPQYDTLDGLNKKLSGLESRLNVLKDAEKKFDLLKKEHAIKQEELRLALEELPEQRDIPSILRTVSQISGETGVRIKYFEPKGLVKRVFYSELPIDIRYTGSYQNMGLFFDEIRNMQRIMQIPTFNLSAKQVAGKTVLEGSCVMKTFIYVKDQQIAQPVEQKKGGAPAKSPAKPSPGVKK